MAKTKQRTYDASDYKELMDNTGGWAKDWDDVIWYLQTVAVYDADFAKDEVPGMTEDVKRLKEERFPFTTDYRKVWHKLTGEDTTGMPEPEGIKAPPVGARELAERYLKGLKFPAKKDDAIAAAKRNDAPKRVTDVLEKIEDKEYKTLGSLLEAVGDVTWDHD